MSPPTGLTCPALINVARKGYVFLSVCVILKLLPLSELPAGLRGLYGINYGVMLVSNWRIFLQTPQSLRASSPDSEEQFWLASSSLRSAWSFPQGYTCDTRDTWSSLSPKKIKCDFVTKPPRKCTF